MWPGPSSSPEGDPPPQNIEDIKEQFDQQQTLIAQLKDTLMKNEQQLATKEKEAEEYATKLSGIKSRSKGLKRGSRTGSASKQDVSISEQALQAEEPPGGAAAGGETMPKKETTPKKETEEKKSRTPGKSVEKLRQGNLNLLRKKLEENRMKFEQRSSVDSKQIEEKVEQLRLQLQERDQKIQELQKGLEAAPTRIPVKAKSTDQETFQQQGGISLLAESSEPLQPQEMYAQMVYKDKKIMEQNSRILQLEASILDLQENLKEKDEVIDARTRAIALMSEEKEKKRKFTQDNLDDTREQMRLMQHNFISLEAEMKQEKQELMKQIEAKDRRLHQLEESNQKLESVRYDLSTRIAELQSKVVNLQTQNSDLQKMHTGGPEGSRVEQLLKQLDDANKQMIKNKAQYKNKIKQLTKQLDSLKKVSDASGEILQLQQRVAELEEDKGNLQLHLVDFDELKAGEERWQRMVEELEERVKQQSRDLDSHLHALSLLEAEKLDLVQGLQEERLHTSTLVSELEALRVNITELENLKVAAEMKAIELEEQVDILSREKSELQEEFHALSLQNSELKQQLDVIASEKSQIENNFHQLSQEKDIFQQQIDFLQQEKVKLQQELSSLQASTLLAEADSNRSFQMLSSKEGEEEKWKRVSMSDEPPAEKHVKDSSNHELSLKLLEAELDEMRKTIAEQKDIIADLNSKLVSREEDIEMQQEMISKLEQLGQEVSSREGNEEDTNKISEIVKELNEMASDLEEWKTRCSEVEDRLKSLENEKVILEKRLEEVTNENSDLDAQLRLQKQVSEEAVSKLNEQTKLSAEQRERISDLEKLVGEARDMVNERERILVLKEMELSELSVELNRLKEEVQMQPIKDDSSSSVNNELAQLQQTCREMEAVINLKESELLQARENLEQQASLVKELQQNTQNDIIPGLTSQIENLSRAVAERDATIEHLSSQCQEYNNQLDYFKKTSSENSSDITQTLDQKHLEIQELTNDLDMTRGVLRTKNEELSSLKQELESKVTELAEKNETLEKSEQKIKEQTQKMKKLAANLKAKAIVVRGHEEREGKFKSSLEEKERIISELTEEKNKYLEELNALKLEAEEKAKALDAISEKFVIQETSLRSEEMKIEGLTEHIRQLSDKISSLEDEMIVRKEEKEIAIKLAEEHEAALRNQVTELEREMSILQMDLRNRIDEVTLLKEEKEKLEEENKKQEGSEGRNEDLVVELSKKEAKLAELLWNVEELTRILAEKDMEMGMMDFKVKDLERLVVSKDMQLSALQDQLSGISERYQQSWSALEAKLQEREAFIESLEQDLARSREHERHLEEGLSNLEERRHSLEAKYEALGERLQESDRIKEEVEEHEDMLEMRLTSLMTSEENLRRKLDSLSENNSGLSQKISNLTSEKEDLKRALAESDNAVKNANKEIERLLSFEAAYNQSLEKIQHLEAELKHSAAEFERALKEKLQKSQHLIENLELDLKNVSGQVQLLEEEKHALMEHCEKLNDLKCNLEEEIEDLNEKNGMDKAKISELQNEISQKLLEIENLSKEKDQIKGELERKVMPVDAEVLEPVRTEELLQSQPVPIQENVKISELSSEVSNLKALLAQKESELQGYQSRLLQLHFGGTSSSGTMILSEVEQSYKENIMRLEEVNRQLQEQLYQKNNQVEECGNLMSGANSEMDRLRSELASSYQKIEELSSEMRRLHEEIGYRDSQLHQQIEDISQTTNANMLSQQIQHLHEDYESRLSNLTTEKDRIYKELLQEKAKVEVNNIVRLALSRIQEMEAEKFKDSPHTDVASSRTVRFDGDELVDQESGNKLSELRRELQSVATEQSFDLAKLCELSSAGLIQELQDKLSRLRSELEAVKEERDVAILRIEEFTSEYVRSQELEMTLNELRSERDAFKIKIEELTSEQAHLQKLEGKISELSLELESVRSEKDNLTFRVEKLTADLLQLQEMESQYNELQHNYNLALARIEFLSQKSSLESEGLAEKASSSSPECGSSGPSAPTQIVQVFQSSSMPAAIEEAFQSRNVNELQEAATVIDFGSSPWEESGTADDGWGWGSEEARLEEEHLQKQQQEAAQVIPDSSDELKEQITELETKLNELQEEKVKLLEELRISQVRSGKLLTKLKDFKLKNENLMRENQALALKNENLMRENQALGLKKNDFADLDSAIEEELKIRIDSLEKELKECTNERDAAYAEKESLLKRIDTLTAANERFVEMKERQDIDVEIWQRKNKELVNQVESLQWKLSELSEIGGSGDHAGASGGFHGWDDAPHMFSANTDEVQEQLAALAADNEHLQNILEEQRNMRIAAEATIKELERKVVSTEQANTTVQDEEIINALRAEITALRAEISAQEEKYEAVLRELEQTTSPEDQANLMQQEEGIVDGLREENTKLREKYEALLQDLTRNRTSDGEANVQEGIVDVLRAECATLRERYESVYRELELSHSSKGASDTLQANYEYLQFAHERLGMEMSALQESYRELESDYEKVRTDLEVSSQANDSMRNDYNKQIEDLQKAKSDLEEGYQILSKEHETLINEFQNLTSRYSELSSNYNVLEREHAVVKEKLFSIPGRRVEQSFVQTEQHEICPTLEKQTGTEAPSTFSTSTMTEQESSKYDEVEEKQKIIAELQDELKKKTAEMDVLRDMISTEQQERADTENELNYMISSLQSELEKSKLTLQKEHTNNEILRKKEEEILSLTAQLASNQEVMDRMKSEIQGLTAQLSLKEQQLLEYLQNQEIEQKSSQKSAYEEVFSREEEIQNMLTTLAEKEREMKEKLELKDDEIETLKVQILERERRYDELMFVKDEDIQNLRIQYTELDRRSQENLDLKDRDIYNLQLLLTEKDKKIYQMSQILEDESKQVTELQELLDKREDELKELIRAENARQESRSSKLTENKEAEAEKAKVDELEEPLEESSVDQQQRELDITLYMLHQRDVRCDELTLELMQLLEERDTLQLRLSSALRINEELRSKLNKLTSATSSPVRVPVTLLTSSSSESSRAGEGSSEAFDQILMPIEPQPLTQQQQQQQQQQQLIGEEPREDLQQLANKLSQLHRIDYRRDVTVHEETQQRHSEQMQLLQQRGAGIVVESNYTLSRDVQSPSTVLLNWIWGRSTPRVMHI
ncbi:protein lava lamp [Anabrus simplex]|uniref:protein lava lamp n=1 Tax=Anabrus simplex TaxID=316456 RepID=UPI0035A3B770